MYNAGDNGGSSSPSLVDVIFSGNSAGLNGGAIYNNGYGGDSSPSFVGVIFSDNRAESDGGAMFNQGGASLSGGSSPSMVGVIFSGNSAEFNGGAIYNNGSGGSSSPSFTNVSFFGNFSGSSGGAVYNDGSEGSNIPIFTNVTFSGNSSGGFGGAMFNLTEDGGTSSPVLRNSIVWNNKDKSGNNTLSASIYNLSATVLPTHSLVQGAGASGDGWTTDASFVDGGGNIDQNPNFISPVNPSSAPTTAGNLRLQSSSPAVDAGSNTYITVPTDLEGNGRIVDGNNDGTAVVDMGAYEVQKLSYLPVLVR